MAQFHPIDYGSGVSADTSGIRDMEQATQEHAAKLTGAVRNIGDKGETLAGTYAQNVLHRQVAESMAKAAEGAEKAINVIETNPYVITRDKLTESTDPETADKLWQQAVKSGDITRDDQGNEFVPTHVVGRDLYAAMSKKSREEAAQNIALPGWRASFLKSAEIEALSKQEKYVDGKLASMGVAYDRTKTLQSADKMADVAMTPEGFDTPIRLIQTSPSFSPQEKAVKIAELRGRQDSVVIDKAMTNPVANEEVLKSELLRLQSPDAAKFFPNHDEKWRAEEAHHVMTGLHMAELQRSAAMTAQAEANKREDDARILEAVKGLVTKKIDPAKLFANAGQEGTEAQQLWTGFKTREGIENFYHIAETFQKNQEAGKDKDEPGSYAALTDLYMKDPQEFTKQLFSGKTERTPMGEFNFSTALSPASMHHFMEMSASLSDKTRAAEDRVREESLERRMAVVMTSPEGGGVNRSEWANPQDRPQWAEHEQFVRDALTREQKAAIEKGKHLTPEQETKVMMDAAAEFRKGTEGRFYGSNPTKGIFIETARGRVNLPLSERTDMEQARRDVGGVGVMNFQSDGQDYFDHYEKIIDKEWKSSLPGEAMTKAESYRVFYEARRLTYTKSITDPEMQVAFIVQKLARAAAIKKSGGTK
jgi:hypothetical protein